MPHHPRTCISVTFPSYREAAHLETPPGELLLLIILAQLGHPYPDLTWDMELNPSSFPASPFTQGQNHLLLSELEKVGWTERRLG